MSTDKLDVSTEQLTKYATQSTNMAAQRAAIPPLVTPPAAAMSPLDAALGALAEEIRGAVSAAETADNAAVLSLIHISEPTRLGRSRMPSSA